MEKIKTHNVYVLPEEDYCGVTSSVIQRMSAHRKRGRNTNGFFIVQSFTDRREALEFEKLFQLTRLMNGYIYTDDWRKIQADRLRDTHGEKFIYPKRRKPVMCLETGEVYRGVRECEMILTGKYNRNLCKHLQRKENYATFHGRTYDYVSNIHQNI